MQATSFSIRRLRTWILVALLAGCAAFSGVMFTLVRSLSERFGPEVEADLEWRALRGAQELARTADVGLAVSDAAMVKEAFGAYVWSSDVQAIVAVDAAGHEVARHGTIASIDHTARPSGSAGVRGQAVAVEPVFAAEPGILVRRPGYLASWAPAVIEGSEVGKVAIVVSTRRLTAAEAELARVSMTTVIAGLAAAVLGVLVILFFTRQVSLRDHQLKDYAHNLEEMVEARTRELDERNRGMRLVLDNVAQGFITIDLAGVIAAERSATVERWFAPIADGMTFEALLARYDEELSKWFALGLDGARDGLVPVDLALDQLPRRFAADGKTFEIAYSLIARDRVLVIISDITAQIVRERAEREARELVALVQRIAADRAGFDEFLDDAGALVASLAEAQDPIAQRRIVHTLKGNCAIYGFERYAELCHELETELADHDAPLSAAQRASLVEAWAAQRAQMAQLLGEQRRNVVEIELAELARVVERARQGVASRELAAQLTAWSHEPIARRFERLAKHAVSLARRLGKGALEIAISDDGIRLETAKWAPFWAAMVHAVRNAVDHGIEPDRAERGKPPATLTFIATRARGRLVISVSDDGAGIAWDRLRARAIAAGLPHATRDDLEQALFADGVSTRDEATETSGRGVGLSALRDAVHALGGAIEIESEPGRGTTLRFRFPEEGAPLSLRTPTQPNVQMA